MENLLKQLQAGDITFNAFYRETEREWRAMATTQYSRMGWRLQGSADLDDVFQEMMMSIPKSLDDFDEERSGSGLKRFVVWRAFTAAKDFINHQCGAYRGRTAEPPRAPTIASMMIPVGASDDSQATADDLLQRMSAVDADQEWCVDVRSRRAAICQTMVDHVVMTSLLEVGGSLQAIADAIYNDRALKAKLGLTTLKTTYGLVRRTTDQFATRAASMAATA